MGQCWLVAQAAVIVIVLVNTTWSHQMVKKTSWLVILPFPPALPTPMTTKNLIEVTTLMQTSKVPTSRALENSALLLYSLLAVCIVLLFSNLFIALAVFVTGRRTKASKQGCIESTEHKHKGEVPPEQDVHLPGSQFGKSFDTLKRTNQWEDTRWAEHLVHVSLFQVHTVLPTLSQLMTAAQQRPVCVSTAFLT